MATDPIASFSGLASGVQWRDLVDQLMQVDATRRLTPLKDRATAEQKRADAWGQFSSLAAKFRDAAKTLRDASAFGAFKVNVSDSPVTGRPLLSATSSAAAAPGTYKVEVLDTARANKLSGNVLASASTALGIAGDFAVNGRQVTVAATDSLAQVRDKINALNSGATATGVTATVLSTGANDQRLVLTSDTAGASGIELVDGTGGALQQLGLVDASTALNLSANGGAQTHHVLSSTAAIATMLGITMPTPSTITVGGQVITVDLAVDSLSSIQAKIAAAGGSASVETETVNGQPAYKLVTDGTVSAATADGTRTLEVLGFLDRGRSAISQVVQSANQYTDGTGAAATASTLLTDLKIGGSALGVAAGDTFSVQGLRGDGSAVTVSLTVGASDTMQTLLDKLNDATSGFGSGTRTAAATLSGGRIVLTDSKGGDSQLTLSLSVNQASGGTIALGRTNTATVGRLREVTAGANAKVRVDGVVMTRTSNTISDAIPGVTLNLQRAEVGSDVDVAVTRDSEAMSTSMNALVTAYNDMVSFVGKQQASGQPLANSSTLRSSVATLTKTFLTSVSGTTGTLTQTSAVGLSLGKDGTLALDAGVFKAALASNFNNVVSLFATRGTATNANVSYIASTDKTVAGSYAVNVTATASTPRVAGAGFSGTYADDGSADTMSITDGTQAVTGSIQLANGDTTDTIADKLNAMFAAQKMNLTAVKSGTELVVQGSLYGTAATFTVAYTGGGTDGSAQLGVAAGTYTGTDVAGTIGGLTATGKGQTLVGDAGGATEGLAMQYTGVPTGAVGTMDFVVGAAGSLFRSADAIARATDGTAAAQQTVITRNITFLNQRADTVQQQLDRRRQALISQFTAMEAAISRIQSQGSALTGFITSLESNRN
jgi:flagellar hook-associated protein 2